jgi:glycolate oxidase FAD binding subunit
VSTPGLGLGVALDPAPYAGAGGAPRAAVRPASREELCDVLKSTAADHQRLVPFGGPPSAALQAELPAYDLAVDLSALDRVIEYEPEDLTLTAECGCTLDALRATLGAHAQDLPVECDGRTTLGGALASNAAGPRRLRFGAPRDRILGARFVLADGTLARSGGRVVKNVAGYGIHRLLCGSRGALAIIVEASLKLAPAPAARMALVWDDLDAARIAAPEAARVLARLEPAVAWIDGDGVRPLRLTIGLEDDRPWIERQASRVESLFGRAAERHEADEARRRLDRLGAVTALDSTRVGLTLVTPERLTSAVTALTGIDGVRAFSFDALAGRGRVEVEHDRVAEAWTRLAERGIELVEEGSVILGQPLRSSRVLGLRSRIREALDPGRRLALGDRWERRGG